MELTARYGLEFNPFLKNAKEILYKSDEWNEASFRLDYLAKTKGFGLLTGSLSIPGSMTPVSGHLETVVPANRKPGFR